MRVRSSAGGKRRSMVRIGRTAAGRKAGARDWGLGVGEKPRKTQGAPASEYFRALDHGCAAPCLSQYRLRAVAAILVSFGCPMKPEDLTQLVADLSPAEQSAVRQFIRFLKERNGKTPEISFQAAVDEFIAAHPDLLRRLAQ